MEWVEFGCFIRFYATVHLHCFSVHVITGELTGKKSTNCWRVEKTYALLPNSPINLPMKS